MTDSTFSAQTPSDAITNMLITSLQSDDVGLLRLSLTTLIQRGEYDLILEALNAVRHFNLAATTAQPLSQSLIHLGNQAPQLSFIGQLIECARLTLCEGNRKRRYFDLLLDFTYALVAASEIVADRLKGRTIAAPGFPGGATIVLDDDTLYLAYLIAKSGVIKQTITIVVPPGYNPGEVDYTVDLPPDLDQN